MTPDYTPWIVCAAMRMKDGLIVPGARHFSPDMRALLHRIYGEGYHLKVEKQGFIDQRGVFHDRQQAHVIAMANGQVRNRVGGDTLDGGTLFSEALYWVMTAFRQRLTAHFEVKSSHVSFAATAVLPQMALALVNNLNGYPWACLFNVLIMSAWLAMPCYDRQFGDKRPFHYVRQSVLVMGMGLVLVVGFA